MRTIRLLVLLALTLLIPVAAYRVIKTQSGRSAQRRSVDALFDAQERRDSRRVLQLIDRGTDVNSRDPFSSQTLLMWAAASGDLELVRALLRRGADPDLKDRHGRTARDYARGKRRKDIAKVLLAGPEAATK
jgi:hypothetical protein